MFIIPESLFTMPGIRVHVRLESVFTITRNTQTPSLHIVGDTFHCFGCGKGGKVSELPEGPWEDDQHDVVELLKTAQLVSIDATRDFIVLKTSEHLTPDAMRCIRRDIQALWTGLPEHPEVLVLEGDMTFDVYRREQDKPAGPFEALHEEQKARKGGDVGEIDKSGN